MDWAIRRLTKRYQQKIVVKVVKALGVKGRWFEVFPPEAEFQVSDVYPASGCRGGMMELYHLK
jgi:hypothetical protein